MPSTRSSTKILIVKNQTFEVALLEVPMKRMGLGVLIASLVLALSLAPAVFAQNFTASVRGTVLDAQGAAIAGAEVTITHGDTGYSRGEKTEKDGNYSFQSLPLGRYTLKVTKEGFQAFEEKNIILHVNDSLTFDAQLTVGARTET